MSPSDLETIVSAHYAGDNIAARIIDALGLQAAGPGSVSVDTLFPADQLHHGGVGLTERMAEAAGLSSGQVVLDSGSGIGGSGRFLADRFDCQISAVDLSPDFVETAQELDRLVGLSGRITHQVGSVTDLPFASDQFDVVWCQNVTMNVEDKSTMFAEAFRVLKPGGVYVLSHIASTGDAPIDFPAPWARTQESSFTTPPDLFLQALADAGFSGAKAEPKGDSAPPPPPPDAKADESPAMGENMSLRRENMMRAVEDGRLVTMLVTARKPA
ncbi:MAG: methyltransferase domain-containing protein [Pseudomonadota bacterium]